MQGPRLLNRTSEAAYQYRVICMLLILNGNHEDRTPDKSFAASSTASTRGNARGMRREEADAP
jgi:hypothetical protein